MDSLLSRHKIKVGQDMDRVTLQIGRLPVSIPYSQAFKIAQGLQLGAKYVMRLAGQSWKDWQKRTEIDEIPSQVITNDSQRSTLPSRFEWTVAFEGELVRLTMGNVSFAFHFTVALKLVTALRLNGRNAKRWAGDTSRQISAMGMLSDAEQNYKHGL